MAFLRNIVALALAFGSLCMSLPATENSKSLELLRKPQLFKRSFDPVAFPLFGTNTIPLFTAITGHDLIGNIFPNEPEFEDIDPNQALTELTPEQVGIDTIGRQLDSRLVATQNPRTDPISVTTGATIRGNMRIAINITIQPYAGANWIHLAQLADPNGQVPNGRASLLESTRTIIRSNAQRNLVRARGSIFVVPNPVQGFVQQRAVEIATVTWTVTYLN